MPHVLALFEQQGDYRFNENRGNIYGNDVYIWELPIHNLNWEYYEQWLLNVAENTIFPIAPVTVGEPHEPHELVDVTFNNLTQSIHCSSLCCASDFRTLDVSLSYIM